MLGFVAGDAVVLFFLLMVVVMSSVNGSFKVPDAGMYAEVHTVTHSKSPEDRQMESAARAVRNK